MARKILAVATNANPTLKGGKRTGLWLSELTHFLDEVVKAGYDYDVASPRGGVIPLDEFSITGMMKDPVNARFMNDDRFKTWLERSLPCSEVKADNYDAIFLAGGHGTMWDFRQSPDLQRLITAFHTGGKFVTGVCHGVAGLVGARDSRGDLIVRGKRVTGFSNLEDRLAGSIKLMPFLLEDALIVDGADYRKNLIPFTQRVESDGVLITGQNPQSAKGVGSRLVEHLGRA